MNETRFLVIPETWMQEASAQLAERNGLGPFYTAIPIADYEKLSGARLRNLIIKTLRCSNTHSAVVVLPKSYATGIYVRYWPDMLSYNSSGILVTSILFGDKWTECSEIINASTGFDRPGRQNHNVTCQYQPPYTYMLEQWTNKGAQSFHPGDYFKKEFLNELAKMQGHWLYWGHADGDKLHGYNHLSTKDILQNKPVLPLHSTLWFSCSTLDMNKKSNIALDWYLNGATHCLLASTAPVNTTDNQRLGMAWLEILQNPGVTSVVDIIQKILLLDQKIFGLVLSNYRLLGLPWVKFI